MLRFSRRFSSLKLALPTSDVKVKGRYAMAERLRKMIHGLRIAVQFWWLKRSVEHLRKTVLKRSDKNIM